MKYLFSFLRLIRWPNLVFIALAQCLFYFVLLRFLYSSESDFLVATEYAVFFQLMGASLLIAAAGYVINDYFDINIDHINKPEKVIVGKVFKRRQAIALHWILSAAGFILSIHVYWVTGIHAIWIGNLICIILLWFYSAVFKKRVLVGNVIVSALTAWVIGVVYFFAGGRLFTPDAFRQLPGMPDMRKLFFYCLLYSVFAFIISLIREVVKDMEDAYGDESFGCRTIPLQWGFPAAKIFCLTWMVVLLLSLLLLVIYGIQSGWWWRSAYVTALLILPLLREFSKIRKAQTATDYGSVSNRLKWIMLAGILSMLLTPLDI